MPARSTSAPFEHAIKRMARIGRCFSPSFSPDAARLAFVSDLNGLPQVWTVPTGGGWPELVTSLDDQVNSVFWSPDGAWLAFSLAPGGGINHQIYRIRPDGTEPGRLSAGGKEMNWLGGWTHRGKHLMVGSNRRIPDAIDGCLLESESGKFEVVVKNNGVGLFTDISRDGLYGILFREQNRSDNNLYLVDLASGQEHLLTPHDGPGSFERGLFSPDGRTIYLSSNQNRELIAFACVSLTADHQPGPIEVLAERDDAELQEFALNEEGTLAALLWNVAGRNELAFLNLRSNEVTAGPQLPGELATELTWSRDGRLLAMSITGAARPLDIWVLTLASGRLTQVTQSAHAGVQLENLVQPELVTFPAHDGL